MLLIAYFTLAVRCLLGTIFTVSAVTKLRNRRAYRSFATWVAAQPVPGAGARVTPMMIGLAEVATVVLLAIGVTAGAGLTVAALLLGIFAAGAALAVRRGARTSCQCFGPSDASLGMRHVARDLVLAVLALVSLIGLGSGGVRPAGIVLSAGCALAAAAITIFLDDLAGLFSAPLQSG